jgi:hypothetical protein
MRISAGLSVMALASMADLRATPFTLSTRIAGALSTSFAASLFSNSSVLEPGVNALGCRPYPIAQIQRASFRLPAPAPEVSVAAAVQVEIDRAHRRYQSKAG